MCLHTPTNICTCMCAISDLPFTVPHVFEYASCLHVHVEKPLFLNEICVIYQFLHGMIYRYLFTNNPSQDEEFYL